MAEGIFIQWELLTGIGIPGIIAAIAAIRYFWKKEKCFIILREKVEQLNNAENGSHETHSDLYKKVNKIERNLFHLMGKLDVKPIE